MKLDIHKTKELKAFINSLPDTDLYIAEGKVRIVGNSCMLPMPLTWKGKKVKYIVVES